MYDMDQLRNIQNYSLYIPQNILHSQILVMDSVKSNLWQILLEILEGKEGIGIELDEISLKLTWKRSLEC